MNVLTQLQTNRSRCLAALETAEREVTNAEHPFEKQAAAIKLAKAQQNLKKVTALIITEEERQNADEIAWLDT